MTVVPPEAEVSRSLTLDELLHELNVTSEQTDDAESCHMLKPPCDREAVYVVHWGPDRRMPLVVQCLCRRRTHICLPCYESTVTEALLGGSTTECVKCGDFMVIVRAEPLQRGAA